MMDCRSTSLAASCAPGLPRKLSTSFALGNDSDSTSPSNARTVAVYTTAHALRLDSATASRISGQASRTCCVVTAPTTTAGVSSVTPGVAQADAAELLDAAGAPPMAALFFAAAAAANAAACATAGSSDDASDGAAGAAPVGDVESGDAAACGPAGGAGVAAGAEDGADAADEPAGSAVDAPVRAGVGGVEAAAPEDAPSAPPAAGPLGELTDHADVAAVAAVPGPASAVRPSPAAAGCCPAAPRTSVTGRPAAPLEARGAWFAAAA
jgi:hypothetical protein